MLASSAGPRGPKRPRSSHTCIPCRTKKLKCDRSRPVCSRCIASHDHCCFEPADESGRGFQFVPGNTSSQSCLAATDIVRDDTTVALPEARVQQLEERVHALHEAVQALHNNRSFKHLAPDRPSRAPETTPTAHAPETTAQTTTHVAGHLSKQAGGRTRFISYAHWATLWNQIDEIDELLYNQIRYHDFDQRNVDSQSSSSSLDPLAPFFDADCFGTTTTRVRTSLAPFIDDLPNKATCDALIEAFIWNYHPIVPLVHVPTFRVEYKTFWDFQHGRIKHPSSHPIPLILAAMFAGCVACSHQVFVSHSGLQRREVVANMLRQLASKHLHMAYFPRVPTVESLSAYMILQGTLMREEEPLSSCGFIGNVVRAAQMLGLNRDPSQFSTPIDPVTAEVRRRVWWHVFHLDVLVSSASGLPPLIDSNSHDVRAVSELSDEAVSSRQSTEPADSSSTPAPSSANDDKSVLGVFLRAKMAETYAARKLLDRVFDKQPVSPEILNDIRHQLTDLQCLLYESTKQISALTPLVDSHESDQNYNRWAQLLLSCLGDKNWWLLASPAFHQARNSTWQGVDSSVLEHCRTFLKKYICLSCLEDFQCYHWAWPGNHQPLQAIIVLVKEIERQPQGTETLAFCQVVDEVLALCQPHGGVSGIQDNGIMARPLSDGGDDAWVLIRRLRSKAWLKAGLDPDAVHTREEVMAKARQNLDAMQMTGSSEQPNPFAAWDFAQTTGPHPDASCPESLGTLNLDWEEWILANPILQ